MNFSICMYNQYLLSFYYPQSAQLVARSDISKLSSQCPRTVGADYSLHRISEGNHINL